MLDKPLLLDMSILDNHGLCKLKYWGFINSD